MKIYAPVKDFNGLRNNVRFVNGVGETDDTNALDWFQSHGYKVALIADNGKKMSENDTVENNNLTDNSIEKSVEKCDKFEVDFDSMSADELRNWGRANGYGAKIKNTRNKEKLLEIIRG